MVTNDDGELAIGMVLFMIGIGFIAVVVNALNQMPIVATNEENNITKILNNVTMPDDVKKLPQSDQITLLQSHHLLTAEQDAQIQLIQKDSNNNNGWIAPSVIFGAIGAFITFAFGFMFIRSPDEYY